MTQLHWHVNKKDNPMMPRRKSGARHWQSKFSGPLTFLTVTLPDGYELSATFQDRAEELVCCSAPVGIFALYGLTMKAAQKKVSRQGWKWRVEKE